MKKLMVLVIVLTVVWLLMNHCGHNPGSSQQILQVKDKNKADQQPVRPEPRQPVKNIQLIKPASGLPQGHLFDENPVVDLIIGLNHFALCLGHLKGKDSNAPVKLSAKQQAYLQPYYDACETEQEIMSLYNQNNIMLKLQGAANDDRLKLLMKVGALNSEDWRLIQEWVVDMKAQELLLASALVERYLFVNSENDLATALGSRDARYNGMMVEQGFAMLACKKGMDCSHSSGLMLTRCADDERACGLNYFEYLEAISLSGFKRDLAITVDWIKNTFAL